MPGWSCGHDDGGRLGSVVVGGRELLVAGDPRDPISWGSYPMAPWAGRVNLGRFAFDGQHPPAAHHDGSPRDPRRRLRPAVVGRGRRHHRHRPRRALAVPRPGRPALRAGRGRARGDDDRHGRRADAGRDRLAPVVPTRAGRGRRAREPGVPCRHDARARRRRDPDGGAGAADRRPLGRRVHGSRRGPRPRVARPAAPVGRVHLPLVGGLLDAGARDLRGAPVGAAGRTRTRRRPTWWSRAGR